MSNIDMRTLECWAEQKDDTEPISYDMILPDFDVYINRDHNLIWSYGIGVKSEFLMEYKSGYGPGRAEMARNLLDDLKKLKVKLDNARLFDDLKKELKAKLDNVRS